MDAMATDIRYIKGIGEKRAQLFKKLGVNDLGDLISYFPRDYEDRSVVKGIGEVEDGETVSIRAMISAEPRTTRIRKGLEITKVRAVDGAASMELTFFNQRFVSNSLRRGESYIFFGPVKKNLLRVEMTNPVFAHESEPDWGIVPIYSLTAGLTQKNLRSAMQQALLKVSEDLSDVLPEDIRARNELCHSRYAYEQIHFPESWEALSAARNRLIFEELFAFSCALCLFREERVSQPGAAMTASPDELIKQLPFSLTKAQLRALGEIRADLAGGPPMSRLVQGDVGSGKTVVAAAAAFIAAKSSYQTALMAPTEILARQHYDLFRSLLEPLGVTTALLTGGLKASEKSQIQEELRSGSAHIVIGTHALITQSVAYDRLGLVITDEQHRFGVGQRAELSGKGDRPHLLVMSATPIPRTMALIIYGDLDISVIDELPPGRQKVDTFVVGNGKRQRMYGFVRAQVEEGRQVFIVCPTVEEAETPDLKSAEALAAELRGEVFPDLRIALLHGRIKSAEKERIMQAFLNREYDILVSTTVIEVGVDVPNASLMIIENAERFGLSQLHQLRGRVGRGRHKSYCILVSDSRGGTAQERLRALCKTNDGFVISEEDLRLRGPGDFFGRRQHGLPDMKIASISGDTRLLKRAQQEAEAFVSSGKIEAAEFAGLRLQMRRLFAASADIFS